MNAELLIQYITYVFAVIGALSFMVSIITQVIKEMPRLKDIQTNVVALTAALVICPVTVIIACQYFGITIKLYYIFASFLTAFIVYLVSTGGWERVKEMWKRTKFNKKEL